jgi:hypothetical protein
MASMSAADRPDFLNLRLLSSPVMESPECLTGEPSRFQRVQVVEARRT